MVTLVIAGVPSTRYGPSIVRGRYRVVQVEHGADWDAASVRSHCDAIRWWLDQEPSG
jgi:hypothetical protein